MERTRPTISVLCPVWNNARYLPAALASVSAQTLAPDEIIVVDDGSTDDSAAIAEATPGVRCVRAAHGGVAAARNAALAVASGDILAWLDSDDLWTPDKLEVQLAYLLAHPEVDVCFTQQRMFVEPGVEVPHWVRPDELAGETPVIATCSMMVRRTQFNLVGGFDTLRESGEDTDWTLRAMAEGLQIGVAPATLLLRRIHAGNLSTMKHGGRFEMLRFLRLSIARKRRKP